MKSWPLRPLRVSGGPLCGRLNRRRMEISIDSGVLPHVFSETGMIMIFTVGYRCDSGVKLGA